MIGMRVPALLLTALTTLLPAAGATDILLKNDSLVDGSTAALQGGFVPNETGAAVLSATPSQYPLTLKDIQVMVLKNNAFPTNTMTVKLYVWNTSTISGSSPSLASAIYTSPSLTFTQGGFNLWDVSADNVVVTGAFTVGCQILSSGGIPGIFLSPTLVTDADGCQNGKNWVRQTNGVWANLCSFGVSGDLAIRVEATTGSGQFISLGNSLAGNFAPTLTGSGSLAGGGSFTLAFVGMPPSSAGPLFVGLSPINVAFKGGVLVPSPDIIITLATGSGSLSLPAGMPVGVPSNFALYLHAWFPDAGGPAGADATNALKLLTP